MFAGCIYSATCVGMIVYRIWNARENARDSVENGNSTQSPKMTWLDSVIRIVVDSALGYTLVSLTIFITQAARSNAIYITSGAVSLLWLIMYTSAILTFEVLKEIQAVGIAFNLINIRVADLRNEQEASRTSYNGNAPRGIPIAFAGISEPSYELDSALIRSRGSEDKSRARGGESRSSV